MVDVFLAGAILGHGMCRPHVAMEELSGSLVLCALTGHSPGNRGVEGLLTGGSVRD